MKKLLALVLALVMTLGLATVSSNAAYSDAADVTLTEAVDVMSAVGVFQGSDGKFAPKDNLTREQAAKLIAYLDLGEKTAETLPAVKVFDDVEATRWSSKYIAYCANAGYIAGVGDNKFNPTGELTGYAFGKMLLCVLGYDAAIEGLTGASWSINVAKLMEENDIAKSVAKAGSATLTREEAAQFCLNALKADMVRYASKGTNVTMSDGSSVTIGASAPTSRAALAGVDYDASFDGVLQLCEKLYGDDLVLTDAGTYGTDDFGRAVSTWVYKNDEVATHASSAVATFTGDTKAADVVTALKGYTVYLSGGVTAGNFAVTTTAPTGWTATTTQLNIAAAGDALITVNGNAAETFTTVAGNDNVADTIADLTANGRTVEIYANSANKINRVVVTNYVAAKITAVTSTTKDSNTLTTYTLTGVDGSSTITAKMYTVIGNKDAADTAGGDNAEVYADAAKDDYVTVAVLAGPKYVVYPTTTFTGAQSAITSGGTATIGGSSYKVALGVQDNNGTVADSLADVRTNNYVAVADFANSKDTANYYVDQFGYLIKTTAISVETKYAIIDRIALVNSTGTGTNQGVEAVLAFSDGSTKTVSVAKIGGIKAKNVGSAGIEVTVATSAVSSIGMSSNYVINRPAFEGIIVTYSENSDGSYNLEFPNIVATQASTTTAATIKAALDSRVTGVAAGTIMTKGIAAVTSPAFVGNNSTVYLVESQNSSGDWSFKSYTGYANAPTITTTTVTTNVSYATKSGSVKFVYVEVPYNAANSVGATSTGTYAILNSNTFNGVGTGDDAYTSFSLIVDGVAGTEVKTQTAAVHTALSNSANKGKLYELTIDADGYTTAVEEQDTANWTDDFIKVDVADATDYAKDGVLRIQVSGTPAAYAYDGDTLVYVIEDNELVAGGEITSLTTGDQVYIKRAGTTGADAMTAEIVYIVR